MSDAKASARARVSLVLELAKLTSAKLVSFAYLSPVNASSLVLFNMSVITCVRVEFCGRPLVLNRDVVDIVGVGRCAVFDVDSCLLLLGSSGKVLVVVASVYVDLLRVEVDEFKFEVYVDESEDLKTVAEEFSAVEFKTSPFSLVGSAALSWIANRLGTKRAKEDRIIGTS